MNKKFNEWPFGAILFPESIKAGFVTLVTNSAIGDFGEHVASHFISTKIKHFAFDGMDQAKDWIM